MVDFKIIRKIMYYRQLIAAGYTKQYAHRAAEISREEYKQHIISFHNWLRRSSVPKESNKDQCPPPSPQVCFSEHLAAVMKRPFVRKRIINHIAPDAALQQSSYLPPTN